MATSLDAINDRHVLSDFDDALELCCKLNHDSLITADKIYDELKFLTEKVVGGYVIRVYNADQKFIGFI